MRFLCQNAGATSQNVRISTQLSDHSANDMTRAVMMTFAFVCSCYHGCFTVDINKIIRPLLFDVICHSPRHLTSSVFNTVEGEATM